MQKLMTNLLTLLQFNIFYEKDKTMSKNEMIEKLRMERVWKSGGYRISLLADIRETLTNLKNTKNNLTQILNTLQNKKFDENTLTK